MVNIIRESGKTAKEVEMEYGSISKETVIMENGLMAKEMVLEFTSSMVNYVLFRKKI
jgi:hypothetical protein